MKRKTVTTAILSLLLLAATVIFILTEDGNRSEAVFHTGEENVSVSLEVADSRSERRKGLMYRKHLPRNHGMLFVFQREKNRSFWMKNTYIPLDIIFLDSNMTVIDIDRAEPEPGTPEKQLKRYHSDSQAKYVIEMEQGFSQRNSIEAGDTVSLNLH